MWVFITVGCNYTKHLQNNQTMLGANTVKINTEQPIKYKGALESAVLAYANPQPNSRLLDLSLLPKYKLWKYNNRYEKYKKDSLHEKIVKRKVEAPVLLDTFLIRKAEQNMKQFMMNQGYFYARVKSTIVDTKNPKIKNVQYVIEAGKSYTIDKVTLKCNNGNLKFIYSKNTENTFIKKGMPFTNFSCGLERERLYKIFRNNGMYDFKSENISFIIDTADRSFLKDLSEDPFEQMSNYEQKVTNSRNTIDIEIVLEQTRDSSFAQQFFFNNISVEIDDPFNKKGVAQQVNTLDDIEFRYTNLPINRNVITRNIFISKGNLFKTSDVEATMNRLNQLGVFSKVNIRFDKDTIDNTKLNCIINLVTTQKMDLTAAGDLSTSDGDYFMGIGGSIIYKNKNLFHGANQFLLRTSYATQFRNDNLLTGSKKFYLSGNNIGINGELSFPKFISPFKKNAFDKRTLPYTVLGINYNYIQRLQNFTITNLTGTFGYSWKETNNKLWRLNPSFLTLTNVPERLLSSGFKEKIEKSTYLKNVFSNNTIYGENVTFTYKNNPMGLLRNSTTWQVMLEEAGTLISGVNSLYKAISNNQINSIARYIKIESDLRRYIQFDKSQWVNRLMIGVGAPMFGNTNLPYIKQYSAGGAFSNRGWKPRTLGPGRSVDSSFIAGSSFIDRTGDIKLEMNTEYRMNLLKLFSGVIVLKGALFADIGNLWLFYDNDDVKGGAFELRYFLNDLAVSTGAGLRFDFSMFIFRLDLGFPIKQPQYNKNYGFAFDQLKWKSGVWNIAIGYPF